MKWISKFSPVLFGILTVTTLYQANAARVDWQQIFPPLLVSIVIAITVSFLFWLNPLTNKTWEFPAGIVTLVILLFFGITWGVSLAILAGGAYILLKHRRIAEKAPQILGVVSCAAIVVSLVISAATALSGGMVEASRTPDKPFPVFSVPEHFKPQNIYFIIPDRLPSPSAQRESGLDPGIIKADLSSLGFYVPDSNVSHDPYIPDPKIKTETTRTMRYLAAVLNDGKQVPLDASYQEVRAAINDPSMFQELHNQGYTITNVGSWFAETKYIAAADVNLQFDAVSPLELFFRDELSVIFWDRTILRAFNLRVLEPSGMIGSVERARAEWQKSQILNIASSGKQGQFVLAHFILPHEPYVFGAHGEPAPKGTPVEQYYRQIQYADKFFDDLARLIRKVDFNATIIIQADEGMGFRKPASLNYSLSPNQWNGVFTAWYVPDT